MDTKLAAAFALRQHPFVLKGAGSQTGFRQGPARPGVRARSRARRGGYGQQVTHPLVCAAGSTIIVWLGERLGGAGTRVLISQWDSRMFGRVLFLIAPSRPQA